ncbi:hypothetical protein OH809_45355 (plasmid) [Streptomyces sp. NBC_00873]|uniref:hypothetical protein n=1 Tax=Streptomyces sp. NBC_00873 TaxID=2975852 RepID=UPI0037DD5FBC|nr:hypothetical protein OH809_45355 [Streptomyces sp. NBC_00873]
MTNFDSPNQLTETMIRSAVETDCAVMTYLENGDLRDALHLATVNAYIAALATEALRRFTPDAADAVVHQINQVLAAGDLSGPAYRTAQGLGHDPNQWIAEFNERTARRKAKGL